MRLAPFDVSTPDGRSSERYRRVALAAAASAIARAVSIATALVSVPLTLRYLGAERYGLWMTISSAIAMLGFADLGLNNGLVSAVAAAHGRGDRDAARECISSAMAMLLGVAALLAVGFAVAYPLVPWPRVFNVTSASAAAEAGPAMAALAACFLVSLPLGAVQRVQLGYQEGFATSLWQASGSVLGLVAVLVAIGRHASLPWLVLAMAGAPAVAALLNGVAVFGHQRPWLRPRLRSVTAASARRMAQSGALYFALQVVGALAFQSDNLVIAHYLGATEVAQYAVPMKLFAIIPAMLSFVLTPLWPAYGEAIARREVDWVMRTFRRLLLLCVAVAVPATAVLVVFGRQIIAAWVGTGIAPSIVLLVGLGLWAVLNSLTGSFAMLFNGANQVAFQIVTAMLMGAANVAASIFLVRRIGVAGPIYGSVLAILVFTILPCAVYAPRLFASWRAPTFSSAAQS